MQNKITLGLIYLLKFQTQMKNKKSGYWKRHRKKALTVEQNKHLTLPLTSCEHRYVTLPPCASVSLSAHKTVTASDRLIVRVKWKWDIFSKHNTRLSTKGLIVLVIIIFIVTHVLMLLEEELEKGLVLQEIPQNNI